MKRAYFNRSFAIGMLAGSLMTTLALILWFMPALSFKKHGELIFTDLPKGINTVTFKNDLVDISVTDLPFDRDVPFEINLIAQCKDHKYGSMWGYPHNGIFYFEYKNTTKDIYNSPPINDIDSSHPRTKIKIAQPQR